MLSLASLTIEEEEDQVTGETKFIAKQKNGQEKSGKPKENPLDLQDSLSNKFFGGEKLELLDDQNPAGAIEEENEDSEMG